MESSSFGIEGKTKLFSEFFGDTREINTEKQDVAELVTGGGENCQDCLGQNVFKMLIPEQKHGTRRVIEEEYIKNTCKATKAQIRIFNGPLGSRVRAVLVSAKEEPNSHFPPAVDCLLRVHQYFLDWLQDDNFNPSPGFGGKVSTRLLVPPAQAGSLIVSSVIQSISEGCNCIVRVFGAENLPVYSYEDMIVVVEGEPVGIHMAITVLASHLRKFLVGQNILSSFEMQMEHLPRLLEKTYYVPYMPPPPGKQLHRGISAYGREAPMPVHSSSDQPAQWFVTQAKVELRMSLSYADAIIGREGENITYIRRLSCANITIVELPKISKEMELLISGTTHQIQIAEQLMQIFVAEAGGITSADQLYTRRVNNSSKIIIPPPKHINFVG